MPATANDFEAMTRRFHALRSEFERLGFAAVAPHAANSLLIYGSAPNYGLDGFEDRLLAARVREAINAYVAAQTLGKAA